MAGPEIEAGFTALVVEDEPLIALDTEDMLRELGASDVRIIDHIEDARAQLAEARYGVVVFDLDLGGVSTEALVTDYAARGHKAIVVSGSDREPPSLVGAGVRMLTKPIDPAQLRGALAETGIAMRG